MGLMRWLLGREIGGSLNRKIGTIEAMVQMSEPQDWQLSASGKALRHNVEKEINFTLRPWGVSGHRWAHVATNQYLDLYEDAAIKGLVADIQAEMLRPAREAMMRVATTPRST